MELNEVLQSADKLKIDTLPGDLLAAIWTIVATEGIDRRDSRLLSEHNRRVLAAHRQLDAWRKQQVGAGSFLLELGLEIGRNPALNELSDVLSGAEGHTHPIQPNVQGTGLIHQGKTPRFDSEGHSA